ncbi:MAG TPA: PEGA domain-containing protein, partial [Polyangiales bacterium]|nr:PEGA domain-containing protein [Polyangiales bacterium]
LAASAAGALLMLGISQFSGQDSGPRVATDTSTSAAHAASGNATVIATEPSGAELLLDGAVVGNTPLEVVRPPRGQGEHTYVLRLRGFTQELVRLNAESQPAIRVTLTPESGVP